VTPFVYQGLPARVVFGTGTLAQLPAEVARLGVTRALVLATPGHATQADAIAMLLGDRAAGTCTLATMHTPVAVTEQALAIVRERRADAVIAVGGGSTIGLGKAIALRTGLPQLAVPTTYAGSEMTPILGETRDGVKTTQRTLDVLPEVVLYDVDLTLGLPAALSGTSGVNAIAHAVEALYASDHNPIIDVMALEAIAALARALRVIAVQPRDRDARSDALYGACLCGICLGAVGMSLHHKLCHTLGGAFGLPHAETHAVVLPHAVAYNTVAVPGVMARVAAALGATTAAQGLWELARTVGAPRALRDLGMPEAGIDHATTLALAQPYPNPRTLEPAAVRALIAAAWAGLAPTWLST
jgi:alcohol dehydrogenase class IV